MTTPARILRLLPLVTLLGTAYGLWQLARRSELLVLQPPEPPCRALLWRPYYWPAYSRGHAGDARYLSPRLYVGQPSPGICPGGPMRWLTRFLVPPERTLMSRRT